MSYTILYRSMFVKLSDGRFIPMVEMGDNNLLDYNSGRGKARRYRSWTDMNLADGRKFFTEQEIMDELDRWNDSCERKRERDRMSDDSLDRSMAENGSFGYYEAISVYGKGGTCSTTFNDVRNIVKSGIRDCISFKEAVGKCELRIVYWEKREGDTSIGCRKIKRFDTEEEMMAFLEEKSYKGCYFAFSDGRTTDKVYSRRKAVRGFMRKGNVSEFIVRCLGKDRNVSYLVLDNDGFRLSEDMGEATWFTKYKSNGADLFDLIYDEFDGITSTRNVRKTELEYVA